MTRSKLLTSLLLNIVVLPGAGQMSAKQRKRGLVFVGLVILVLLGFVLQLSSILKTEFDNFDYASLAQIKSEPQSEQVMKLVQMSQVMSQSVWANHAFTFRIYIFFLAALYIISCLDLIWVYWDLKEKKS